MTICGERINKNKQMNKILLSRKKRLSDLAGKNKLYSENQNQSSFILIRNLNIHFFFFGICKIPSQVLFNKITSTLRQQTASMLILFRRKAQSNKTFRFSVFSQLYLLKYQLIIANYNTYEETSHHVIEQKQQMTLLNPQGQKILE